jgi:hypothetical protein
MDDRAADLEVGERYIVEALEHPEVATIEDARGVRAVVPRTWLPPEAVEGDVVVAVTLAQGEIRLARDDAATAARRREMQERHDRLPRADDGDLDL